jgi:predicted ATPase
MEQVLAAAPELVARLEACPGVRLLVNSREPLHVELEVLHAVAPLGVPNLDVPLALADLQQESASGMGNTGIRSSTDGPSATRA